VEPPPPAEISPSFLIDSELMSAATATDPRFVLVSQDPTTARALIMNSGTGVNLGPLGTSADSQGKALPSYFLGDYDAKEDISAIQPLLDYKISFDDEKMIASAPGYSQSYDTRLGLLTTHLFQHLAKGWAEVRITDWANAPYFVSRIDFRVPPGTKVQIDGDSRGCIGLSEGKLNVTNQMQVSNIHAESAGLVLRQGYGSAQVVEPMPPAELQSVVGAKSMLAGLSAGYQRSKDSPRIDIDGPLDDQQAVDSWNRYLTDAARSPIDGASIHSSPPIPPMGPSSSLYGGHTFWDADIWLMPALAFVDPSILSRVSSYRLSHLQPAPNPPFSWESAISGKELAPPEFAKEIHIDGDVVWGLEFAKALGADIDDTKVKERVNAFYVQRSTPGPDKLLNLADVKSPDESHTGSNDLYTNLLAQWSVNGATWHSNNNVVRFVLPHDSQTFLTYDGDPLRSYKQAAAVLAIYPLQYPPAEAQAKRMLERFEDKVISNGPAMSDSVHALIWARLGDADRAYDVWQKSWEPFLKGPMLLFSEKRSQDRSYFTTGAAGCLQTVIYGFLGFRVDEQPKPSAAWQTRLRNGRWLSIDPHLPSAWKSVTFRNFTVLGHRYTLTVRREGAKTITTVQ
jgi:hypothetical protein